MDDQQLRQLVREAITRHLGPSSSPLAEDGALPGVELRPDGGAAPGTNVAVARFHLVRPAGEVECIIEPTVACNHCGHCLCYGH